MLCFWLGIVGSGLGLRHCCPAIAAGHRGTRRERVTIGFLVPVRGYGKGCSPDNVKFVGIAA